jgi:hypothetical protein
VNRSRRRHVPKNYALRQELINKGHIVPVRDLAEHLKKRGFIEASKEVASRVARNLPLFWR